MAACSCAQSERSGRAEPPPALARFDERVSARLGPEHAIRSRFAELPVVEPCLSAHPVLEGHLLVGAMLITDIKRPYESGRLLSFLSTDGGTTWSETVHDSWDYDPWSAIAPDGRTVLSWIGTPGGFRDEYPIQLFRSSDGGRTFERTQTLEGNHDGTKVVAWRDRFWFTTVRFREDMETEIVLLGARGPGDFAEVASIPGRGERLRFCEPAVLSDGRVVVPVLREERAFVQVFDPDTGQLGPERPVPSAAGSSIGYPRLVADQGEGSPHRDSVYFARAASEEGVPQGLWLSVSRDGGSSWNAGARIDHFEPRRPSRAMLASLAVNRAGVVAVSWVDRQEGAEAAGNDVYLALSLDGGTSFQRPVRVSTVSSDPRTARNDDVAEKFPGGGHYMGIAACPDGSFQLVWSDSREGLFVLRTRNATIEP